MILFSEGATRAQEDEANDIIAVLCVAYPGHPWAVRVYDGGFFIRHLSFPTNWGMNCKFRDTGHDWAVMKREIISKAGEWLERAGMARGRYDGDWEQGRVEGVPDRFQPPSEKPKLAAEHVEFRSEGDQLRDTAHPQALALSWKARGNG